MKEYFETKEAAEKYREENQLYRMVAVYIDFMNKWALVFPLKAHLTVCEHDR